LEGAETWLLETGVLTLDGLGGTLPCRCTGLSGRVTWRVLRLVRLGTEHRLKMEPFLPRH
jgi:hypothetical protein